MPRRRVLTFAAWLGVWLFSGQLVEPAALAGAPARHGKRDAQAGGTLRIAWRASVNGVHLQPYLAASRRTLFVSGGDRVVTLDLTSGRQRGELVESNAADLLSSPTVVDEAITVAADSRNLYAISREGREVWRLSFGPSGHAKEFVSGQAPMISTSNGSKVVIASGADGQVYAVSTQGKLQWHAPLGVYADGIGAIPLAVHADAALFDVKTTATTAPGIVAMNISGAPGKIEFAVNLGIDVSSLVAGPLGIAATSYVETTSKRGSSVAVLLDRQGHKRWEVKRGRHEHLLAMNNRNEILSTSQDPQGADAGADLEWWGPGGSRRAATHVDAPIRAAFLADDGAVYALACGRSGAVAHWFDAQLAPHGSLPIGVDCPVSATLDDAGQLIIAHELTSAPTGGRRIQVIAIQTPSQRSAPGWAMPRADARGSASDAGNK
jgi:hypothetical protein